MTLPSRPLHTGETFRVLLTASNPLAQRLTGWEAPLRFNNLYLRLVGWEPSGLWLAALASSTANVTGGTTTQVIGVSRLASDQPAASYRSSSSIPLAEVTFQVLAPIAGSYPGVLALGTGARLEPSWAAPPVAFHDHRGGVQTAGSISVVAAAQLGAWAWAEAGHVFNTARFTGARVVTRLFAALVTSWAPTGALALPVTPLSCTPTPAAAAQLGPGAARAASVNAASCTLNVDASNAAPAKDLTLVVTAAGSARANATLSVWQPGDVAVSVEDAVLNSVLPLNAAPPAAGCSDYYQATRVSVRATWSNGGNGPGDTLTDADVTRLATLMANDSSVVLVDGATLRGVAPGMAAISIATYTPRPAPAVVTVTNEPACLVSLEALATTGVSILPSQPVPQAAGATITLSWQAAQNLAWEGTTARVVTLARFTDGGAMDVSDRVSLALDSSAGNVSGATTAGAGFLLGADTDGSSQVTVNASARGDAAVRVCGAFLAPSWDVCSLLLGRGTGQLLLDLPRPVAVANLSASPAQITAGSDAARLPPIDVPTSAALSVAVSFSDGTVRDFSADPRTSFSITAGAALCRVSRDLRSGVWSITTTGSASSVPASQTCGVTANITFAGTAPPLSALASVRVVALRSLLLYRGAPTQLQPPALPPAEPALDPARALRLLRCDAQSYDSLTLWPFGVLTNCSGPASGGCVLLDLNNRAFVTLNTSAAPIARVMDGYPANPSEPRAAPCGNWQGSGTGAAAAMHGGAQLQAPINCSAITASWSQRAATDLRLACSHMLHAAPMTHPQALQPTKATASSPSRLGLRC